MEPQQTQGQPNNDMGDTKASLAFSNMLREQQFMQENPSQEQPTEVSQSSEIPSQENVSQESDIKMDLEKVESNLSKQIEDLRKEIRKDNNKDEIEALRKELTDILNEKE